MSDKASEHCAEAFIQWLKDNYNPDAPIKVNKEASMRYAYLAGYEKGREAGRAELVAEAAEEVGYGISHGSFLTLKKVANSKALARDGEKL